MDEAALCAARNEMDGAPARKALLQIQVPPTDITVRSDLLLLVPVMRN